MNMDNRTKYIVAAFAAAIFMGSAYIYPAETFLVFTVGWLFFIPAAFIVYMVWGYLAYMKERKHKIVVSIQPTDAMRAIAMREAELKKEKERLLYQEYEKLK
jgi:membrane protein implicated in regulation of membrane protease activity